MNKIIAISQSDFKEYGCPHCNCDYASGSISGYGAAPVTCQNEDCKETFVILADGLEYSPIGIGRPAEYPSLIDHPHKNTKAWKWGAKDERPTEPYTDFYTSRGVGYDLAGFVKSKEAGERIINMVRVVLEKNEVASWLDFRPHEPKWIQVKFQPSEFDNQKLHERVLENSNVITMDILKECKK